MRRNLAYRHIEEEEQKRTQLNEAMGMDAGLASTEAGQQLDAEGWYGLREIRPYEDREDTRTGEEREDTRTGEGWEDTRTDEEGEELPKDWWKKWPDHERER